MEIPADIDPKMLEDPVFQRVMADALAIQDRFAAKPVYATSGKGYLKSAGVAELREILDAKQKAEESKRES